MLKAMAGDDKAIAGPSTRRGLVSSGNLPQTLLDSFLLTGEHAKSYKQQYANMYFMRLAKLKPVVLENATRKWADVPGDPVHIPRVLEVVKSQLCFIIGTVYMDMPLKPNVLADIGKEHWIIAPLNGPKFYSPEDSIMLEDESGRIKLVGDKLSKLRLVTGVIMAALGVETSAGEFQVLDTCFAGMAPQPSFVPDRMNVDDDAQSKEDAWVAIVSGLDMASNDILPGQEDAADIRLEMLIEYLRGESGGPFEHNSSSRCTSLIILGNSLHVPRKSLDDMRSAKKYSLQATWDPAPLHRLARYLKDLSDSIPIYLLPGPSDPAGATLPQQPMPRAMFGFDVPRGSKLFSCESNPTWLDIGSSGLLATAGQPLDDIFKYLESEDRLAMARDTIYRRHIAPTCPDTLWCYPIFDADPFILTHSPSIYAVGNQPDFQTEVLQGGGGQKTRVVLVPKFSRSGEVVLVNVASLDVKTVRFGMAEGWSA